MLTNRQLFLKHLGQTSGAPLMLEVESAEGCWLFGPGGERYLDLVSGVCVSNTGHGNRKVIDAIKNQSEKYLHLMVYGEYIQSPQVKYAELLSAQLPANLNSFYFVNSGSEAVEGALKLAKRLTGREKIIYFRNSYHGSTHGALSIQGSEFFRMNYRPLLPGCIVADYNSDDVLSMIDDRTACVIAEPVQAEAGVIAAVPGFLEKLRNRCSETGTLLVFDEVQTAFGRIGSMTAAEKYCVQPDIMVLGKALGGGMPLGAFAASGEIMDSLSHDPPLGHITTFGGHPVCCAAGMASLEYLIDEKLIIKSEGKSELFRKYLADAPVKEIRGEGLLLAVVPSEGTDIGKIVAKAPQFGIVTDYFLFCNDAFRIAPPLTIEEEEIRFACEAVIRLIEECRKK